MNTTRGSIRLRELMAIVFVLSFLGSVVVPWLAAARRRHQTMVCADNLRQLDTYLVMYVSKL